MAILKRKNPESKPVPPRSLHEVVTERVLTAEGWRRRALEPSDKKEKKKK